MRDILAGKGFTTVTPNDTGGRRGVFKKVTWDFLAKMTFYKVFKALQANSRSLRNQKQFFTSQHRGERACITKWHTGEGGGSKIGWKVARIIWMAPKIKGSCLGNGKAFWQTIIGWNDFFRLTKKLEWLWKGWPKHIPFLEKWTGSIEN